MGSRRNSGIAFSPTGAGSHPVRTPRLGRATTIAVFCALGLSPLGCGDDGASTASSTGEEGSAGTTPGGGTETSTDATGGASGTTAVGTSSTQGPTGTPSTTSEPTTDGSTTGEPTTEDRVAAFPEACGYGAQPRDWSDATRIVVTNLDDSGPGSFREAMRTEGKRIVTFAVGGTIQLESRIFVDTPRSDVYVVGQTAPGDGIQIIGPTETQGHLIRFVGTAEGNFDNAILRFLSFRGQKVEAASGDVMAVQSTTNFVLDHCSLAFSSDEILGFNALNCAYPESSGGTQHNIGVTNNLVAEPFEPHTTAAIFATLPTRENVAGCPDVDPYGVPSAPPFDASQPNEGTRDPWPSMEGFRRLTIHRNVFSAATHRMPLIATVDTSHTNNIAYGAEVGTLMTQGAAEFDSVGNMYLVHAGVIESPLYGQFLQAHMIFNGGNRYDLDNPQAFFDVPGSLYIASAYMETAPNVGAIINPWAAVDTVPVYWRERAATESNVTLPPHIFEANWPCDGSDWRCTLNAERTDPLHHPDGSGDTPYACEVDTNPGPELEAEILQDVGNSRRVDCNGDWQPRRQPTDVRQLDDVAERSDSVGGPRPLGTQGGDAYPQLASIAPNNIDEVGGYDVLAGGDPCPDDDADGMPNAFEARYGLDEAGDDAFADPDGDGYTNLEEWFNGTQPQ